MVQRKTVLTLKRETSKSYRNTPNLPHALTGYLLKVSVDIANNIDRNIFVWIRDVQSNFSPSMRDTFDSIASVGELEWLPVGEPDPNSSNFYRSDTVELMFESARELEAGWKKISRQVKWLAEANDYSLDIEEDSIAIYPGDAIPRYFGPLATTNPSEEEIRGLSIDYLYQATLNNSVRVEGLKYIYYAFPSSLGEGKMYVNGNQVTTVLTKKYVENDYALSIEYNLYRIDQQFSTGTYNVTFTPNVIRYSDIRARSSGYTDVLVIHGGGGGSSLTWVDFQFPGALQTEVPFGFFKVPTDVSYECYGAFSSIFDPATGASVIADIINADEEEQERLITIGQNLTQSTTTFGNSLVMASGSEWKLKILQKGSTNPGQFLNVRLLLKTV